MKKVFILAIMFPMYLSFSLGGAATHDATKRLIELNNYEKLVHAITTVESGNNPLALGVADDTGLFQITKIRLKDYNQRTGSSYVMNDMYDPGISRKIFDYYAYKIGINNHERIAREWNRAYEWKDSLGNIYWKRVTKYLNY